MSAQPGAKLTLSAHCIDGKNEWVIEDSITERALDNAYSDLVGDLKKMIEIMRSRPIFIKELKLTVDREIGLREIGERYKNMFETLVGDNYIDHVSVIGSVVINAPGTSPEFIPGNQNMPQDVFTEHDSLLLSFFAPFFVALNIYPIKMHMHKTKEGDDIEVWPVVEPEWPVKNRGKIHRKLEIAIETMTGTAEIHNDRLLGIKDKNNEKLVGLDDDDFRRMKGIVDILEVRDKILLSTEKMVFKHKAELENRKEYIEKLIELVQPYIEDDE